MAGKGSVECPVCGEFYPGDAINQHVNRCLNDASASVEDNWDAEEDFTISGELPSKRVKCDPDSGGLKNENKLKSEVKSLEEIVQSPPHSSQKSAWGNLMQKYGSKETQNSQKRKISSQSSELSKSPLSSSKSGSGKPFFSSQKMSSQISTTNKILHTGNKDNNYSLAFNSPSSKLGKSDAAIPQSSSGRIGDTGNCSTIGGKRREKDRKDSYKPLAERMRPLTLKDYVGQEQIVGQRKLLRLLVESHHLPSIILWGPPGCGKTTLARIIAEKCKETHDTRFVQLSATTSGVSDVKKVVEIAKNERKMFKRQTVLFIDEVHRFNKLQQDTFLPHIEDGTIILIGATTENPSFQVNNALLSRCRVMVLEKLEPLQVEKVLRRALPEVDVTVLENDDLKQNTNPDKVYMLSTALVFLCQMCDGDARSALNALQTASESKLASVRTDTGSSQAQVNIITTEDIKEALQCTHIKYDRAGEEHYNCASALQKSIRGSSDNGAIYWLARMLEGGEDPLFIARRLVVCASEDIGLADPQALPLAVATFQACQLIGMPESSINLAHCVTYLARAKKSNESYAALREARQNITNHKGPLPGVPLHLRNAPTKLMKDLGYGDGYKYNHAFQGPVEQEYLPDSMKGTNFFQKRGNYKL